LSISFKSLSTSSAIILDDPLLLFGIVGSKALIMTESHAAPQPSALSKLQNLHYAKSSLSALPLEILHNLQFQHSWTDLQLHFITSEGYIRAVSRQIKQEMTQIPSQSPTPSSPRMQLNDRIYLISGLPPRHTYLHPDFQTLLIRSHIEEKKVLVQREWVLPMSLGDKPTLKRFCGIFDALPAREQFQLQRNAEGSTGSELSKWKDVKRVLLGMVSNCGIDGGGDGTVVYYIMQEGEVKPRQNG
jgi:tRNA-splicing endonuclease subunit Sen15, fungi type